MPREKKIEYYDVVIIGGGPGGLSAAIYAGRAHLKTILIEKSLIGGLATYTNEITNYPGFPDEPKGDTITNLMKKQAEHMGVKFKLTAVKTVDLTGEEKVVETFRNKFIAKTVIIATGGRPRITGAKNEANFLFNKGISFCATCDAAANTDKHVVVIGSGDAAIEEGMFLTKFADKVTISVMHDEGIMDCNEIAKTAALSNPKMDFKWNTVVDSFEGKDYLSKVVLKNVKEDVLVPIECDNCFEFIGYIPNTELFEGQIDLTNRGYIPVDDKKETNIPGVFAVGDVTDKWLRQVATAVGDGAIAGTAAEKFIAEEKIFHDKILQKEKPGLIYLYTAIDDASRDFLSDLKSFESDDIVVNKIDIYKSTRIAEKLNVDSFPSIVLTKNGKIVETITTMDVKTIQSQLNIL